MPIAVHVVLRLDSSSLALALALAALLLQLQLCEHATTASVQKELALIFDRALRSK